MVSDNLPNNWVLTKLGVVADINIRDAAILDLSDDLLVTFVPMSAADAEKGIIALPEERLLKDVRKGFTPFSNGDVIFAKITPSMENGKAAIARNLKNGWGFGSTEFHVLRPAEIVTAEWIFLFIRQKSFRQDAKAHFAGTAGQLRVPKEFLIDYPFPLAPFPEQARIVAKIEELFTQLDAGVAALQRVQAGLKRYKASVLKAAVEGRLVAQDPNDEPAEEFLKRLGKEPIKTENLAELPSGWCWTNLPNIGELARGKSKHRPRNAPFLYGGSYPFIQTGDIRQARGVIDSFSQTYSEDGLRQSRFWPKGTLCITIAANIAETAILGFGACFPDSVVGFIPIEGVDVQFLQYYISTIREDIERYAPATAQKNINLNILQKIQFPLPPLVEQKCIVNEVERNLSIVQELEVSSEKMLRQSERLRKTILARAFSGRLVPQNPKDEPAEKLLERLRSARKLEEV